MTVMLGINPNSWSLDDVPELRHFSTLEQCLRETKAAGYAGTELGGLFPRSSEELKPLLEAHDLALVSGWFDGRLRERGVRDEFEALRPHLVMLRDCGARCVVYADCSGESFSDSAAPLSSRPSLPPGEWRAYGRDLTRLATRSADLGIALSFHHHIGTFVESDEDVDRLMESSGDAVGLLIDTGHCALAGGDPLALTRRHAGRINHFHAKDIRPRVLEAAIAEDWSFVKAVMSGVYTVPGDGALPYGTILRPLAEAGYEGWLVVEAEQDLRLAHPLTYATSGYRSLQQSALGAGLALDIPRSQKATVQ